ncbi:DUF6438 domain-containing protein [Hymenobacter koreensis]|uniref:DUF6438 domain-containing protein n=1 Tax=Hymenobacter koreensis TaxID=1084523 RepID=A0ABP8IV19_9BACT
MRLNLPSLLTAALLGASLSACTVNYYVTGDGPRRPRPSYGGDWTSGNGGWQQGPGNGPSGPIRQAPTGTGGVRPPSGTPTGNGGTRLPTETPTGSGPTKPPVYETGGHKPEPPIRQNPTGGIKQNPTLETGGVKPPKDTYETGGHKPEPPIRQNPTGGIKPPKDTYETGGHKPEPPVRTVRVVKQETPAEGPSGTNGQPANGSGMGTSSGEVKYETGGHKPEPPRVKEVIKGDQVIKNAEQTMGGAVDTSPQPATFVTGGIKPMRTGRVRAEENTNLETAGEAVSNEPVIVFRKTPCLGPCPDYEATIWADGRVRYVGNRNVAKEGTHELRIPAATVAEILRQVDEIGFSKMAPQYVNGATDMPSTILTISRAGRKAKTVQVEHGAPDELVGLLNFIDFEIARVSGGPKE